MQVAQVSKIHQVIFLQALSSRDKADEAAGQGYVRGRDAKPDTIGEVGLNREWFAGSVLGDAHSNREKRRWCGRAGLICKVDEPKSAFPILKRSHGETFAGAELRDRQAAVCLAMDALASARICLEAGDSRHGVDS
jgi:hypothetical protein